MYKQRLKRLLGGLLLATGSVVWMCAQTVSAAPAHTAFSRPAAESDIPSRWAAAPAQSTAPTSTVPISDTATLSSTPTLTSTTTVTETEPADPAPAEDEETAAPESVEDVSAEAEGDAAEEDVAEEDVAEESDAPAALDESQLDALYSETLEGTIIANRTTANVSFFVEGELYRLAPLRSLGIDLPRSNSVLNLYSCDADSPESQDACFWDPFLINADGFYEVFNDAPEGSEMRLILETAGTPPTDQVWIQNRTGEREVVVYDGETYELAPSAVMEFDVGDSPVVTFYRRSCLAMDGRSVCEWAPLTVEPGYYYALDENATDGGPPNSQIIQVNIEPVLGSDGSTPVVTQPGASTGSEAQGDSDANAESAAEDSSVAETAPSSADMICQLQVPVLNVRAGPGLEYLVVSQVSGSFGVIGQDLSGQWLAVAPEVFDGGWVAAGEQFEVCNGDISTLAVAEITDGRLEPTPEPVVQAETPAESDAAEEGESADGEAGEDGEAAETDEELDTPAVEVPEGQALLIVTNAFEQDLRFTLSPDEYDLLPGETIYVVVNPGRVQFSASSPWRGGISGNAEFLIEPDQSQTLYLYFVQNPNDSDDWDLYYQ